MIVNLDLNFKGDRNYNHGTDFFNQVSKYVVNFLMQEGYVQKLSLKKFSNKKCYLTEVVPENLDSVIGKVNYISNDHRVNLETWIIETEENIEKRIDYNEDVIYENADINLDTKSIQINSKSVYSTIEEVIALTKKLNYTISPNVTGKWVFGQLDLLKALPISFNTLKITMKSLIENRFSINEIYVDDVMIGRINFIVGSP